MNPVYIHLAESLLLLIFFLSLYSIVYYFSYFCFLIFLPPWFCEFDWIAAHSYFLHVNLKFLVYFSIPLMVTISFPALLIKHICHYDCFKNKKQATFLFPHHNVLILPAYPPLKYIWNSDILLRSPHSSFLT